MVAQQLQDGRESADAQKGVYGVREVPTRRLLLSASFEIPPVAPLPFVYLLS